MRALVLATLCLVAHAALAQGAAEAAALSVPDVQWQAGSEVVADLTCSGRKQSAVLGLSIPKAVTHEGTTIGETNREVVVAVFLNGTSRPPVTLRFPRYSTQSVRLQLEPLSTSAKEFQIMLGSVPEGYVRSKSCYGLSVSDGLTDETHIYWNKTRKLLSAWSL